MHRTRTGQQGVTFNLTLNMSVQANNKHIAVLGSCSSPEEEQVVPLSHGWSNPNSTYPHVEVFLGNTLSLKLDLMDIVRVCELWSHSDN